MTHLRRNIPAFALAALIPHIALASEKEALIQNLIESGTHAHEDERHSVEVDGCTMTTYRWKKHPDQGWVLWSSFTFAMAQASLVESTDSKGDLQLFAATDFAPDSALDNLVLISFKMPDDAPARFEKSTLRERPAESWDSPRGDGTTHFFENADHVNIVQTGPDVVGKADQFVYAFQTYVADYCTFTG